MKNLYNILLFTGVCCCSFAMDQSFGQEVNDGTISAISSCSSSSDPIVLKGITKYDEVKYVQQDHMRKNYEDYHTIATSNSLPKSEGAPFIQSFILQNDEGKQVELLFDISDAYKARKKACNAELKKIVEGLEKTEKERKEFFSKMTNDKIFKEKMKGIKESFSKAFSEELKKLGKRPEELTEEDKKKIVESINKSMKEEISAMQEDVSKRMNSSK